MESFRELEGRITGCRKCPRLLGHCQEIARVRKKEFRDWEYWGKPVPGFGEPKARLWVVGLAPAAHGANRTGRMFTGDSSGNWLYRALHESGFANQAESRAKDDGLVLKGAFVSSAGRCAPPDNKPELDELENCEGFLDAEWDLLRERKLILALGNIAFQAVLKLLARKGIATPKPKPRFSHGAEFTFGGHRILCSFHPSRQNTNTKKLTWEMWTAIFARAREIARA